MIGASPQQQPQPTTKCHSNMARPVHSSVGKSVILDGLRGSLRFLNGQVGTVSRFDPDMADKKEHDYLIVGTNGKVLGWFSRREFNYIEYPGM